jgi:hypothetical protein
VAVLHHADRLVVAVEIDLGERLVAEAVHLQHQLGQQLARVSLGLCDQGLTLEVGERVDFGTGERHDLKVLRVQVGELADLGDFLRVGRPAFEAVDRGARVGETDVRLTFVHAAHVGDPRAGRLGDAQAGNALLPHPFERAAERDPRAALRARHEGYLLRRRRRGRHRDRDRDQSSLECHSILLGKKRF